MTREERIRDLFNKLRQELISLYEEFDPLDMSKPEGYVYMKEFAKQIDAVHHDFTNIILSKEQVS